LNLVPVSSFKSFIKHIGGLSYLHEKTFHFFIYGLGIKSKFYSEIELSNPCVSNLSIFGSQNESV